MSTEKEDQFLLYTIYPYTDFVDGIGLAQTLSIPRILVFFARRVRGSSMMRREIILAIQC